MIKNFEQNKNLLYNKDGDSMQRYFSKEKIDNHFILKEDDYYHIKIVMRMKNNDKIQVVFEEQPYLCKIESIENEIQIVILEKLEKKEEIMPKVTLLIPILKEQKMDYILQKATELGVSEIIPVNMSRSIVKVDEKEEKKKQRWIRIVKEASEQSYRNTIPTISSIQKIDDLDIEGLKIICSTVEKENTIKRVFQNQVNCDKINILIGPEGGIDPKEESILKDKGFMPVTLGNRIMRVETVPLYLMSIINYEYME